MSFNLLRPKPKEETAVTSDPSEVPARLEDRIKQHFRKQVGVRSRALLLDISGSMQDAAGIGRVKITELQKLASKFKHERRFVFSSDCFELDPADRCPGSDGGGTNMAGAFITMKQAGIVHVVLITDGMPDMPDWALQEAKGLRIDIFYVGPEPMPDFLKDLARLTGGGFNQATFARGHEALETKIRGLLPPPAKLLP